MNSWSLLHDYMNNDEELMKKAVGLIGKYSDTLKQLANPEDIWEDRVLPIGTWDESKMTPTGLGLESLEGTDLRTDYNLEAFPHVTRVEVIGRNGREFVRWDCSNVQVSLQDDKRTLKVFV